MWETGKSDVTRGTDAGFTLIELLVVISIIGLIAASVVLALPDSDRSAAEDARILAARASLAGHEAIVSGRAIGLSLTPDGYRFLRRHQGGWAAMTVEAAFAAKSWSPDLAVELTRDSGRPRRLAHGPIRDSAAPLRPDVIFDPTGLSTPFAIRLSRADQSHEVSGNDRGEIRVRALPVSP